MLLTAVVKQRGAEIQATSSNYTTTGIVLIAGGFLWLAVQLMQLTPGKRVLYGLPTFLMLAGVVLLVLGSSTRPRSSLSEEDH